MKSLLSASDAAAVRTLLRVSRDEFLNETGKQWHGLNAYPSTVQKKFGTRSCYFTGSNCYLRPLSTLKLGGSDFAIAFWAYIDATNTSGEWAATFFNESKTGGIAIGINASNKARFTWMRSSSVVIDSASSSTPTFTAGTWHHYEVDYKNSTNTLYFFLDGSLITSGTADVFDTEAYYPQSYFGYNILATDATFKGYIDEVLITNKILHTANFTKPTTTYTADSSTIALLHFE